MYERRILESKKENDDPKPDRKDPDSPQPPREKDRERGGERNPVYDRSGRIEPTKRGGDDPTSDW